MALSNDYELMNRPSFEEMSRYYSENFSLSSLGVSPEDKFKMIMLINYLVLKGKEKKPDVTYYQVIYNLTKNSPMPEHDIYTLAIICNDYGKTIRDPSEIPLFGLKGQDIIKYLQGVLNQWLPF